MSDGLTSLSIIGVQLRITRSTFHYHIAVMYVREFWEGPNWIAVVLRGANMSGVYKSDRWRNSNMTRVMTWIWIGRIDTDSNLSDFEKKNYHKD